MYIYMGASLGIGYETRNETTEWEKEVLRKEDIRVAEHMWHGSWKGNNWGRGSGTSGRQGDRGLTEIMHVWMPQEPYNVCAT